MYSFLYRLTDELNGFAYFGKSQQLPLQCEREKTLRNVFTSLVTFFTNQSSEDYSIFLEAKYSRIYFFKIRLTITNCTSDNCHFQIQTSRTLINLLFFKVYNFFPINKLIVIILFATNIYNLNKRRIAI